MKSSSRNTTNREEQDEMGMRPLNSLAPREAANRASDGDEEEINTAIDLERGEADTESDENVSVTGDGVRCWIYSFTWEIFTFHDLVLGQGTGDCGDNIRCNTQPANYW